MVLRNLSLAKKGLLVLLLPLVYQTLLLIVLMNRQATQAEAEVKLLHTQDVLGQIDRLRLALLTLQGSLRGFVITENPEFEVEVQESVEALPSLLAALRSLTASASEAQHERLTRLQLLVDDRLAWSDQMRSLIRDKKWDEARDQVRSLRGKRNMDAVSDEVDGFRQEAERLDRERLHTLQETTRTQNYFLLGGLLLNVIISVGSVAFVVRNITQRVDRLSENARRFSRGEPLLPVNRGNDELAALDRTFHEMATGLEESRSRERAFHAELEHRNTELERANRELDHKNQENEMFVYSVSHDLRSPLVNLQGFSKELGLSRDDLRVLFERDLDAQGRTRALTIIDRDVSESIHYIQTAVLRLSAIIDALLRLSRAGRIEYQPQMVDLHKTVGRIVTALRGSTSEKAAEIEVGELPPAWGDATALEQILANLLGNAVNYLDPQRPGKIEVGFLAEAPPEAGGFPTYYVKDNGLGIDEKYLPKVFGMFQRLHAQAAKGEGVGLTLVRRMVERHGGQIWVESKPGAGSTFFLALPPREESPLTIAPRKESGSVHVP